MRAQCRSILVRVQGASARKTKALQLNATLQIRRMDQLATNEGELFQILVENVQDGFYVFLWNLDESDGFKLNLKKNR